MPQIDLEETDHERIIRLHAKNGWYSGNKLESAETYQATSMYPEEKPDVVFRRWMKRSTPIRGDMPRGWPRERKGKGSGKSLHARQHRATPNHITWDRPIDVAF